MSTATVTATRKRSTMAIVKWVINIVLPLIFLTIPLAEEFASDIRTFIAISVFSIILIATNNAPIQAIGFLMPMLYVVVLRAPASAAFGAFTQPIIWMIFGSFIMSYGMEKTGLIKRIALRCVIMTGASYTGIICGMIIAGGIVSLVVTDVAAKAILFGTIALSICKALNLELGGKMSAGIGLSALVAVLEPSMLIMHGSSNIVVPLSLAEGAGMPHPAWGEYLIHMFVPQFIYCVFITFAILLMFRPSKEEKNSLAMLKGNLAQELDRLGSTSMVEKKVAVISVLLVAGIVTNSYHGINIAWILLMAGILLLWPGIKVVDPPEVAKCNLPFVIFIAACMSMGTVSNHVGFGPFVAELVTPLIAGSMHQIIGGIFVFGFIVNIILTPLAAYSAFTAPVVQIAETLGINPLPAVYTWAMTFEYIIFPFQFVPVLILFGYGMVSFKDMVKFNAIKTVIGFTCILTIYIGWWKIIGLL